MMAHLTKILITGGCGKIGSYFARFAADRYAIRVADKIAWDAEKLGPLAGESLVVDLQSLEGCRTACTGIDMVIHLAADPSPEADFLESLLANNIVATYNMFRAAKETSCKRFIFASSAHTVAAYPADVQTTPTCRSGPGICMVCRNVSGKPWRPTSPSTKCYPAWY
jgi:nucleoside-diphosphate-sugar epimerase